LIDREHPGELEPRLARDIGVSPSGNGMPEGFAIDPRPLWGIGLTPEPIGAATQVCRRQR
jgi:hypothetical protein